MKRHLHNAKTLRIPAQAGIQLQHKDWIPTFVGMRMRVLLGRNKSLYRCLVQQISCMLILLSLSACGGWRGYNAASLSMTPPDGPEIFQQAWLDGCETGVAANTNDFYKLFARIKQNPVFMKEEIYRRVWQDSYNYCWFHTSGDLSQPI